jgi:hypothetical protein
MSAPADVRSAPSESEQAEPRCCQHQRRRLHSQALNEPIESGDPIDLSWNANSSDTVTSLINGTDPDDTKVSINGSNAVTSQT